MAKLTPFFKSVGEDMAGNLEAASDTFSQLTETVIANDGLFGRKRSRMYFTMMKSVEVPHTGSRSDDAYSLPDLELFIDPQQIQVQKKVLAQRRLTKAGWVLQFWGHDLTTVQVNAVSGYFGVTKGLVLAQLQGALRGQGRQIDPLKVFEQLKENVYMRRFNKNLPYRGLPIIGMVYDSILYRGYFENFNYSLDANNPFRIDYNFAFVIVPTNEDIQGIMKQARDQVTGGSLAGMAAGTILNPDGTVQRISDASTHALEKSAQTGVDSVSKKLGVMSYVDVTPSRVVLY